MVNVRIPGQPLVILHQVQASDAGRIIHDASGGNITPDLVYSKIEEWDHITGSIRYGHGYPEVPAWNEVPFFKGQKKIVLRNCGIINPDDVKTVHATDQIVLWTGNAGAVEVSFNGQRVPLEGGPNTEGVLVFNAHGVVIPRPAVTNQEPQ